MSRLQYHWLGLLVHTVLKLFGAEGWNKNAVVSGRPTPPQSVMRRNVKKRTTTAEIDWHSRISIPSVFEFLKNELVLGWNLTVEMRCESYIFQSVRRVPRVTSSVHNDRMYSRVCTYYVYTSYTTGCFMNWAPLLLFYSQSRIFTGRK